MPSAPLRACRVPGCPELSRGSACPGHRRERARVERRPETRERDKHYDTARWRKLRRWFLSLHPTCEDCTQEGKVRAAVDVDHRTPRVERGTDEPENLRALCRSHHSRRTAQQLRDRGLW